MLKYRLEALKDVVDHFVIVEAMHTHVGGEKMMYFEQNKEIFEPYMSKIIHIVVDDFQYKQPNINIANGEQWKNEIYQRNCIKRGLDLIDLNPDDVITITDLDEIPDPNTLQKIKNGEIVVDVNILEQDLYYYNLNTIYHGKWHHPKIITFNIFSSLGLECNDIRFHSCPVIKNGGWHLSYFGDAHFIKNKIQHCLHTELNLEWFANINHINSKMHEGTDLYNRSSVQFNRVSISNNLYLPPLADILLKKYITF
jgi:beta-1,4-mannosyl-glycoprotein beta-1,4-N-acetylglucosaminyltransferase